MRPAQAAGTHEKEAPPPLTREDSDSFGGMKHETSQPKDTTPNLCLHNSIQLAVASRSQKSPRPILARLGSQVSRPWPPCTAAVRMACAYVIFHCSSKELQARAGFDGWVTLLRDEFDTEDQAWPQERLRLASVAKRRMRRLESGGVELDMLQLVTSCHLLLDPPAEDREEERIWCIEFFRDKMYDFVVSSNHLSTHAPQRVGSPLHNADAPSAISPHPMRVPCASASRAALPVLCPPHERLCPELHVPRLPSAHRRPTTGSWCSG